MFEFINAAIVVKSVFGKLDFRILLLMLSLSPGIVYVSALQLIKDDRRSFDLHLSAPAPDAIDISMRFLLSFGANPIMKLVTIFLFLEQTLDINIAQNHKSSNVDTKSKRASENKATAACGLLHKLQKGVALASDTDQTEPKARERETTRNQTGSYRNGKVETQPDRH